MNYAYILCLYVGFMRGEKKTKELKFESSGNRESLSAGKNFNCLRSN